MRFTPAFIAVLFVSAFVHVDAQADIITLDSATFAAHGVNTGLTGRPLEIELNNKLFNPAGIEFEVGATTGGTPAVDDMAIEGPGLTIITGWGFILRFPGGDVEQVRILFGDFKDGGGRTLHGFDPQLDYTRDTAPGSMNSDGNPIGFTMAIASALDSQSGTVPVSLIVSDAPGRISSVWGDTNFFLTSLVEIEVDFATPIPEPSTWLLMGLGLLALARIRRRSAS